MAPPLPIAIYYDCLRYQPENLELMRRHFNVVVLSNPSHDTKALLANAAVVFAPLGWIFDATKMDLCQSIRAIVTNTTGITHIDVAAATQRNIAVISLADDQEFLSNITPTAEHAWGLLLALMRRIPKAHQAVLEGRWDRRPFGAPAMLSRLRLGVIGYGRLGQLVASYGHAFRMSVKYYDIVRRSAPQEITATQTVEGLVEWADVISLHVPAVPSTRHMINKALLTKCKRGAIIINTARGEVLDHDALLDFLKDGHIGGAALDVLEGEFTPGFATHDHPLVEYARSHDNLLLTPHIGGSTFDAWRETERRVIDRAITQLNL